jgi:NTE family protein
LETFVKKISYFLSSAVLAFGLIGGSGCSTWVRKTDQSGSDLVKQSPNAQAPTHPEVMGPSEAFGPPVPSLGNIDGEFVRAIPTQQKRPVCLVFGPGLARGYSFVGVLRALAEQKIPVGAVVGTEMGALIAALYATSSNINEFEWGLLKLNGDDVFLPKRGFFAIGKQTASDGTKLEKVLRQIFGKKDLSQARIPLKIALQSKATGIPIVLDKGPIVELLRAALAAPSVFTPGMIKTKMGAVEAVSAGASRPYLVREIKDFGMGPTIVIDVLSEEEDQIAQSDLSQADLLIRPEVLGIDYLDYQKRTEAALKGKNAIMDNLPMIKKVAGLAD